MAGSSNPDSLWLARAGHIGSFNGTALQFHSTGGGNQGSGCFKMAHNVSPCILPNSSIHPSTDDFFHSSCYPS